MYTLQFTPENQPYNIYKSIMNLMKITSAPIIPFSEEIVETSEMGDGTTSYRHTGVLKDKTIEVPCNFVVKNKKEAEARMRNDSASETAHSTCCSFTSRANV